MKQIGLESGYSFPIIKPSLNKLEIHLRRYSNHSAELKSFPRGDWFKLLAVSDNIRFTMGYYAHRPRTVETLLERILEKPDRDVAFGGIIGARHYFPGIDLIGTHRLDLTVHNWDGDKTSRFIRMLDPGLKKVRSGEIPQVVLHNLFRPESFFIRDDDFPVADEVECLLDLHEARLEAQALDLLEYLIKKAKK